jgi:hypothetical protein
MSETKFYTDRSNAKRSAERMIEKAEAPALDYTIKRYETASGYRYEIVWKAEPEKDEAEAPEAPPTMAARFGEWYAARLEAKPRRISLSPDEALVGAAAIGEFEQKLWSHDARNYLQLTFADGSQTSIANDSGLVPRKTEGAKREAARLAAKRATSREAPQAPSNGEAADDTAKSTTPYQRAPAAPRKPGEMPVKPVVTSAANKSYQARFDKLDELAAAGDWAGVEAYVVKGKNTYGKMVARYRNALLAAHRAAA